MRGGGRGGEWGEWEGWGRGGGEEGVRGGDEVLVWERVLLVPQP